MPKPIASWPADKPFSHLPTFDALAERSGIKVSKLRVLLKGVPYWKCSDNTVRYDEAAATEALEGVDPLKEELDDAAAAAVAEPLPSDPTQAALAVMNRTLALMSLVVKERGDIVKLQNDTIRTMGEPLTLGQALVREAVAVLQSRLKHYDEMWDTMVLLVEQLQGNADARELAKQQQTERAAYRKESFALAKKYIPDALEKFQLTAEAGLALDILRQVEPDMLEPLIDLALPEESRGKARKLVELLKVKRQAAARAAAQKESSNASTEPATPTESTPASASASAPAGP